MSVKVSNKTPGKIEEAALDELQAPSLPDAAQEPLELSLEDTAALRDRGLKVPQAPMDGYNPYDAAPGARPGRTRPAPETSDKGPGKRTDLRKLSEWILLQRRLQAVKQQNETEDPAANKGPPKK